MTARNILMEAITKAEQAESREDLAAAADLARRHELISAREHEEISNKIIAYGDVMTASVRKSLCRLLGPF